MLTTPSAAAPRVPGADPRPVPGAGRTARGGLATGNAPNPIRILLHGKQGTVGLQAGGQTYDELIVFQDQRAFDRPRLLFLLGLAADASASAR